MKREEDQEQIRKLQRRIDKLEADGVASYINIDPRAEWQQRRCHLVAEAERYLYRILPEKSAKITKAQDEYARLAEEDPFCVEASVAAQLYDRQYALYDTTVATLHNCVGEIYKHARGTNARAARVEPEKRCGEAGGSDAGAACGKPEKR